jgi:adenylosuccinate lyase
MIPRYAPAAVVALFSDEARLSRWLKVELAVLDAMAEHGEIPDTVAQAARERAPVIDSAFVNSVAEREQVTDHDVAAFVDVVQERIGAPEGAWVHFGLTSSDIVDTALGMALVDAADLLIDGASGLIDALSRRARELVLTPTVGRTHGMHAEPTTFGTKFALWALQVDRDRQRLVGAKRRVGVGKLSGAVGTYSNIEPEIESMVCRSLGLEPVPATQVVARDRHAEFLYACASTGATIELIATEIRHLARSEVGEVEEPFGAGQKGSSAMPHKRNPILAERLCGLARVLRGYVVPGLEDVALWHERDISHSSVERIVLPDAVALASYVLTQTTRLVSGLVVHADRARGNLVDGSLGLVFSQSVLLALVAAGWGRDDAYRVVQRDARVAWQERRPFRAVLEEDPEVDLDQFRLDDAFDVNRLLRHAGRVVEALDAIDTIEAGLR